MIEVLVALTMFGLVAVIPLSFLNQTRFNRASAERSGAIAAAQQKLEWIRLQDPATLPASGSTSEDLDIAGKDYYVITRYCSDATYCTSTNNRQVEIEVAFLDRTLYKVETVYTQLR